MSNKRTTDLPAPNARAEIRVRTASTRIRPRAERRNAMSRTGRIDGPGSTAVAPIPRVDDNYDGARDNYRNPATRLA